MEVGRLQGGSSIRRRRRPGFRLNLKRPHPRARACEVKDDRCRQPRHHGTAGAHPRKPLSATSPRRRRCTSVVCANPVVPLTCRGMEAAAPSLNAGGIAGVPAATGHHLCVPRALDTAARNAALGPRTCLPGPLSCQAPPQPRARAAAAAATATALRAVLHWDPPIRPSLARI